MLVVVGLLVVVSLVCGVIVLAADALLRWRRDRHALSPRSRRRRSRVDLRDLPPDPLAPGVGTVDPDRPASLPRNDTDGARSETPLSIGDGSDSSAPPSPAAGAGAAAPSSDRVDEPPSSPAGGSVPLGAPGPSTDSTLPGRNAPVDGAASSDSVAGQGLPAAAAGGAPPSSTPPSSAATDGAASGGAVPGGIASGNATPGGVASGNATPGGTTGPAVPEDSVGASAAASASSRPSDPGAEEHPAEPADPGAGSQQPQQSQHRQDAPSSTSAAGEPQRRLLMSRSSARGGLRVNLQRLDPEMRNVYAASWQRTLARFADDPVLALTDADKFVALLMDERGYPTEGAGRIRTDVATDPAGVLADYRLAHAVAQGARKRELTGQEMRRAMDAYRRMVGNLLEERPVRGRR